MKRSAVILLFVIPLLLLFSVASASAQLSKGFQILLNRGFQIQPLSQDDCYLHLDTVSNANYTAIQWDNSPGAHSSRPDWMGPAPGYLWSRWAWDETQMPPQNTPYGGSEVPNMPQLFALQLGDEWNLNDAATRTRLVDWFNSVRPAFTNVMLYHNNWGSQIGDAELSDFYSRAQPDLLCFDTYPWQSVWDINAPDHIGVPIGGPPTGWYGDLRRYREHARGAGLPLGIFRQMFHSVQDYDQHVFRDPSFSEMRLNTFAALAFNAKYIVDFIYNTGAASLFTKTFNGSGDSVISTNGLYYEVADANKRALNFGKSLIRLTAITNEAINGFTTSILFIRGRNAAGATNAVPVGFLPDVEDPSLYSEWAYQRNDKCLTNNWTVVNKGTKNSGYPGDVIISWFKPLDETFDGPDYTNEVYMMVVNGLTDPTGTAADCLQEIRLNFVNPPLAVEMMNPTNGNAEVQPLTLTNGLRQLVLNLNGGDAALFKFSDGAPFVGTQVVGPPFFTLQPSGRTNTLGTAASFSARAAGAAPMTYQWQFNGTNIPGAITNTYTINSAQGSNNGSYTLVASNASGVVTSAVATLIVNFPPIINTQPLSQTVSGGSDVLFTVGASGTAPLLYQWRFNGTNIFGATTSVLARTNVQSSDQGIYSVAVANALGSTNSSNAVLTVNGAPSIMAQPRSQTTVLGASAGFSVTAMGNGTLTYTWRRDGVNVGNDSPTLTINPVTSSDLGLYDVTVANQYGLATSQLASLGSGGVPVIQTQPQSRTVTAGSTVIFKVSAAGDGLSYQWLRSGTNLVDGANLFGSTTDTLVLSAATRYDATNYTVVVSSGAGSVTSVPASLTITYSLPLNEAFNYTSGAPISNQVAPNLMTWTDVGTSVGGPVISNVPGSLNVTGLAPSSGNSIRFGGIGKSARLSFPSGNARTSGTVYFSFACKITDLSGASSSGGFFAGFNNSIGTQTTTPTVVAPRVYLRTVGSSVVNYNLGVAKTSDNSAEWVFATNVYTLNQTNFIVCSYTFNTGATNDDTVKMWINPDPSTFGAGSPPATTLTTSLGGDITAGQIASFVFFQRSPALEPASIYADELRIDTNWAGVTPPIGAPFIGIQPNSLTVNVGTTATFTVVPSTTNVSYQWIRNGTNVLNGGNISGATSNTLTLSSVAAADAAVYEVIVSNSGGAAVSIPAILSVNGPPQITFQPQGKTVSAGAPATFSVAATGLSPLQYQWRFNGSHFPIATSSAFALSPAQRTNAGTYCVEVSNFSGSVTSVNAILNINPTQPVQLISASGANGKILLSGGGDPGYFLIQSSSNLVDWADLTNLFGGDGTFMFTDDATNAPLEFYRARLYP